jgi:hypothetical protein
MAKKTRAKLTARMELIGRLDKVCLRVFMDELLVCKVVSMEDEQEKV